MFIQKLLTQIKWDLSEVCSHHTDAAMTCMMLKVCWACHTFTKEFYHQTLYYGKEVDTPQMRMKLGARALGQAIYKALLEQLGLG